MCGLAGFVNVTDATKRIKLVIELGKGVDSRGGDAAGFVSFGTDGEPHYGRRLGKFRDTGVKFHAEACQGDLTIIHGRYATCGRGTIAEAHPYVIQREGSVSLWGAHNGVLKGTETSAKLHSREHVTDSRELFELLADGSLESVRGLAGWGTLAWIESDKRDTIYVVAMTEGASLEVCRTKCGGIVFGSTKKIVEAALKSAGMDLDTYYQITVGQVLKLTRDKGVLISGEHADKPITLKEYSKTDYYADTWDGYADTPTKGGGSLVVGGERWTVPDWAKDTWKDKMRDPFHVSDVGYLRSKNSPVCDDCGEHNGKHDEWCPMFDEVAAADMLDDDELVCPSCYGQQCWHWSNTEAYCGDCSFQWNPADSAKDDDSDEMPEGCEAWTDEQWDAYMHGRWSKEKTGT